MKPSRSRRKTGFALPLVLTIVAILTLVFAVTLNSLVNLKEETDLEKRRADFDRAAMSAEARFSFLVATEPLGAALLNIGAPRNLAGGNTGAPVEALATISLDNRPYVFRETEESENPFLAEIMDEAGLFNIYYASSDQLTRFFQQFAGMGDIDASNLATEIQTYLSETTNQLHMPMRRPAALFSRVPTLADFVTPRTWDRILAKITAYPDDNRFNVNTAPPDVISVMFNTDLETATAIVDQREGTIISSLATVGLISPAPGRPYTFPNGRFRFTLIDPKSGLTYRSNIILAPADVGRPLWVENPQTLVTTPPDDVVIDELPLFPDIPNLAS